MKLFKSVDEKLEDLGLCKSRNRRAIRSMLYERCSYKTW